MQAQFAEQLINRRKVYPGSLRDALARGAILRATADYSTDFLSETQAYRELRRAREFVAAIRAKGAGTR